LSADDRLDPRIPAAGTLSWMTINFKLNHKIRNWLRVQAALENILDYAYREHGSGINSPGRNFFLSLIIKK